jgi:glycosyltransferase involved in cell wall biosynthesis
MINNVEVTRSTALLDIPQVALHDSIAYFGNDWAGENRTSSHHVARWLSSRGQVMYFESPGLRAPKGNARDLRKVADKVRLALGGPRPAGDGLAVQTLLQVPLHRFQAVRTLNRALTSEMVRQTLRRRGLSRPISWFVVPHMAPLCGRLGEVLSVYYCIDDYASLPDVDQTAVRRMDDELTRRADLVFVASHTLLDAKRRLNPHTYLSPHGVDYEHFRKAQDPALTTPLDLAHLPRPIIGFFGLIERWIDLDLVARLASQRPNWSFVMIGRVAVPDAEVPRLPNLHFVGKRPYETLPAYGKAFDAAIIPYRLTQQVLHANPIKLREYLAMGKPIVSVSTPEIDKFADVVNIAQTPEAFLSALDKVVAAGHTPGLQARQQAMASTMTWDARLREVMAIVEQRLAEVAPRRR